MLSQYLLIYSEAIKATIKEIKAKTQNRLFYDPSLTHKGGSGGKTDRLFSLTHKGGGGGGGYFYGIHIVLP